MRLIDADALLRRYDETHVGEPGNARKLIEEAPTITFADLVDQRAREMERKNWSVGWRIIRMNNVDKNIMSLLREGNDER